MKISPALTLVAYLSQSSSAARSEPFGLSKLKNIGLIEHVQSKAMPSKLTELFSKDIRSGLADTRKIGAPTKAIKNIVKLPLNRTGTAEPIQSSSSQLQATPKQSVTEMMDELKLTDSMVSKTIQKKLFNKNFKRGLEIDLASNLIARNINRLSDRVLKPLPISERGKSHLQLGANLAGEATGRFIATAVIKGSMRPVKILTTMVAGKAVDYCLNKIGEHKDVIEPHLIQASPNLLYPKQIGLA